MQRAMQVDEPVLLKLLASPARQAVKIAHKKRDRHPERRKRTIIPVKASTEKAREHIQSDHAKRNYSL